MLPALLQIFGLFSFKAKAPSVGGWQRRRPKRRASRVRKVEGDVKKALPLPLPRRYDLSADVDIAQRELDGLGALLGIQEAEFERLRLDWIRREDDVILMMMM